MNTHDEDEDITLSADVMLEPAPEGRHPAICVDVVNLGEEEEVWNDKPKKVRKLALVWQVFPLDGERDSNGAPFLIDVQVTASINDGARLRLLLESWEGRSLTSQELKSLSVGAYKGKAAYLDILELVKNGFIYSAIKDDIIRGTKGEERKFSKVEPYDGKALKAELDHYDRQVIKRKYERMKEGKANKAQTSQSVQSVKSASGGTANDDYIPF